MPMTKSKGDLCIKFDLLTGTTSGSAMTVTGITSSDSVVSAVEFHPGTDTSSTAWTDRSDNVTIGDGSITIAKNTVGETIFLHWLDNSV